MSGTSYPPPPPGRSATDNMRHLYRRYCFPALLTLFDFTFWNLLIKMLISPLANGVQSQPQLPKTKPAVAVSNQPAVTKTFTAATSPQSVTSTNVLELNNKIVPIQLTLPPPAGSQDTQPRVFNIQVPASALTCKNLIFSFWRSDWKSLFNAVNFPLSHLANQLQRVLTAPVISATMALPVNVASTLLQQHVTAALQGQANNIQVNSSSSNSMWWLFGL